MDTVALGAVIVAIVGLAFSWWSTRKATRTAWAVTVQQHRSEAYLKLLETVEREGAAISAYLSNRLMDREDPWPRAEVPLVTASDRAMERALLIAYGSDEVRKLHSEWRGAVAAIDTKWFQVEIDWTGDPEDTGLSRADVAELTEVLVVSEQAMRKVLGKRIAQELNMAGV